MRELVSRAGRLVGIMAVATAAVFLSAGGPAQATQPVARPVARPVAHVAAVPAAAPAVPARANIVGFVVTGGAAARPAPAGSRCLHSWVQINYRNIFHATLAWYRLTTDWCHNSKVVTRRTTTPTGAVTTLGGALGWDYNGQISHSANCYVAAGSRRNCSGQHEVSEGKFTFCALKIGCVQKKFPIIQEWENYRGQFLHKP